MGSGKFKSDVATQTNYDSLLHSLRFTHIVSLANSEIYETQCVNDRFYQKNGVCQFKKKTEKEIIS